jgi:hypothetical protein
MNAEKMVNRENSEDGRESPHIEVQSFLLLLFIISMSSLLGNKSRIKELRMAISPNATKE